MSYIHNNKLNQRNKKMDKNDFKKLIRNINSIHPVLIGLAGVVLLCLPVISPASAECSYVENKAFIAGLVCILYSGVFGVAKEIALHKEHKAKFDKSMQEFYAKREKFKRTIKQDAQKRVK